MFNCSVDSAADNRWEDALLHRRSRSSDAGGLWLGLLLLATKSDQAPVKAEFWLLGDEERPALVPASEVREARAFMMVCRGMESVEGAFCGRGPEIDFWRNRRKVEEGSDQPASSCVEPMVLRGSASLPGCRGLGSC